MQITEQPQVVLQDPQIGITIFIRTGKGTFISETPGVNGAKRAIGRHRRERIPKDQVRIDPVSIARQPDLTWKDNITAEVAEI